MALRIPDFSSPFTRTLPGDVSTAPHPRPVFGALWSKVSPTPVSAPRLVAASASLAHELGLEEQALQRPEWVEVLAGNAVFPGMDPYAANYGGHQFGRWAGQLGDGRAISLGELTAADGSRQELQLKGAGPTPYSRHADGRAVLRSSIREFLCSEAMHALGIPTTRALAVVTTGEEVIRDMFYDGNPAPEPGAVVCRVAPSFLRFGNFELCTHRDDIALLQQLVDYTLVRYFPDAGAPSRLAYAELFAEVARRTARLIARWQSVGFVHGVMNTDNMSILGLTIDYGPYGWLDDFNPDWTPNTTDAQFGRYRYAQQPGIGLWNLQRLAVALAPLFGDDVSPLEQALRDYGPVYEAEAERLFAAKLGLSALTGPDDKALLEECLSWLASEETDMTLFFRQLSQTVQAPQSPASFPQTLENIFYGAVPQVHRERGLQWLKTWWNRTRRETLPAPELAQQMDRVNPKFVLRNYLAQEAIDAAQAGDPTKVRTLLEVMSRPYDEQPGKEAYAAKRPEWARSKPGCSALSCSS